MSPTVGSVLGGDFKLLSPLSSGGMGSVFVAEQQSTGSRRALKVMHPELVSDAKLRERFETEAKVASSIASDHVVQVLVAGVDSVEDTPFLVMELLEGETLGESVERRGALPATEARELIEQLFHALIAAHNVRVVHRDLKPENVFLAKSRSAGARFTVKVLDFGIAKLLANVKSARTQAMGTPLWMAPEQTEIESVVTPATDVWALGLLVFYLFTGKSYWRSADAGPEAVLREVLTDPLVPASQRALELGVASPLPRGFDAVFAKAVARDPAERYADAAAMSAELNWIFGAAPLVQKTEISGPPSAPRSKKRKKSKGGPASTSGPSSSSGPASTGSPRSARADRVAPAVPSPSHPTVLGGAVRIAPLPPKPKAPEFSILPYAVLGVLLASGVIAGLSRVVSERTATSGSASASASAPAPAARPPAPSPGGTMTAPRRPQQMPEPANVVPAERPPIPPELAQPPAKAPPLPTDPIVNPAQATARAPAKFRVAFETTEGKFSVECFRDWSPNGADRFYNLVKLGFYDDVGFFRVVTQPKPFVVQFGLSGDPSITKAWEKATLKDDPAKETNARGTLTFAKKGNPDSRTTQMFINLADNKNLDAMGFTPFCRVLDDGMTVVDRIHSEYQGTPDQGQITSQGNAYLRQSFPLLDYVRTARVATL